MNIFVGNLSGTTSRDDLRTLFAEHGEVKFATVILDRETGQSRGFGFVEMPNDEEARAAIEALNGTEYDGNDLRINEARPREERGGPRREGGGFQRREGGGGFQRREGGGGFQRREGGGGGFTPREGGNGGGFRRDGGNGGGGRFPRRDGGNNAGGRGGDRPSRWDDRPRRSWDDDEE